MNELLERCRHLEERKIEPYRMILEEGTRSNRIFVLIDGSVVIERDGIEVSEVNEPGAIFGEMSVLLDQPHMATVKTASACSFYIAENGIEFLKSDQEISLSVLRLLAGRLSSLTSYLVDIKNIDSQEEGTYHLEIVDTALENILRHK